MSTLGWDWWRKTFIIQVQVRIALKYCDSENFTHPNFHCENISELFQTCGHIYKQDSPSSYVHVWKGGEKGETGKTSDHKKETNTYTGFCSDMFIMKKVYKAPKQWQWTAQVHLTDVGWNPVCVVLPRVQLDLGKVNSLSKCCAVSEMWKSLSSLLSHSLKHTHTHKRIYSS